MSFVLLFVFPDFQFINQFTLVVHPFKLKVDQQMGLLFFFLLSGPGLICPVEKAFVLNDLQLFQRSFPASSVFSIVEL